MLVFMAYPFSVGGEMRVANRTHDASLRLAAGGRRGTIIALYDITWLRGGCQLTKPLDRRGTIIALYDITWLRGGCQLKKPLDRRGTIIALYDG